ncbi:MAG: hypothetical protein IJS46_00630 [Kiritimatiellae bacterium]|nr:hypothetical protein [Kiritimatiellia bacterium]
MSGIWKRRFSRIAVAVVALAAGAWEVRAAAAAGAAAGEGGGGRCAVVWDDRSAEGAARFSLSRARNAVSLLAQGGVQAALFPLSRLDDATAEPRRVVHLVIPDGATEADAKTLGAFFSRGGRVVVHGSFSAHVAGFFGLEKPKMEFVAPSKGGGQWSGYAFSAPKPLNAPDFVANPVSKVVANVAANGRGVSVAARWRDKTGAFGPPAVFRSPVGFWLSRNLYDNGPAEQRSEMLVALTCALHPPLWRDSTLKLERDAWRDASPGAKSFENAASAILAGCPKARKTLVETHLGAARARQAAADALCAKGLYGAARENAAAMGKSLSLAAAAALPLGRTRGRRVLSVWAPSASPPSSVGSWKNAAGALVRAGVDEAMIWAGPPDTSGRHRVREPGFAEAAETCSAAGVAVHAWLPALNVEKLPQAEIDALEKEGRLLHSPSGEALRWLNPAIPANRAMVAAAAASIAKTKGVSGINLDFIRYPDAATREKRSAAAVEGVVRAVRERLRAEAPGAKLTASVYGWHPKCVGTVAQDWRKWLAADLVDNAVPMNYMQDEKDFRALISSQKRDRKRIVCGIGASARESWLTPLETIRQAKIAFSAGFAGVAVYLLDDRFLADFVPALELAR